MEISADRLATAATKWFLAGARTRSMPRTCVVDPRWVAEVSGAPMRRRLDDMISKFDAPSLHPCRLSDQQVFPRHWGGRGSNRQQLQSWLGADIFRYIRERMEERMMHKGQSNLGYGSRNRQGHLEVWRSLVRWRGCMQANPSPAALNDCLSWLDPQSCFRAVESICSVQIYWSCC